jgi:hypothetical protein
VWVLRLHAANDLSFSPQKSHIENPQGGQTMGHTPMQQRLHSAFVWALALMMGIGSAAPLVAQPLSEADFRATIVGTKLTGMLGTHLTFQDDGTLVGGLTGAGDTSGTWAFNGASLCTTIQDSGGPAITNCGVPELIKRHLVVGGENGLRLRHNQ